MPDYIYLLKNRLSLHQRNALESIREAAREAGMTVFLVGGAVRDLTSGSPVNDLDVTVQGNALILKEALEKAGATLWGEHEPSRTLFLRFPVGVSVEISSARRDEFPKPGSPVYHWDTILEDLRRRDFTANAMALSLNEHSYGLLMDPLNGVADIEARQLRLVSNYGFIEDPSRLLRATRLMNRLGYQLDERTQMRFQNAKDEDMIQALSPFQRGYELEEIGHEEDGLRVLAAMEAEGWMQQLFPAWTMAAADVPALEEMRRLVTQLQMQGVNPDMSAISIKYLTAKLAPKDLAALKAMLVRPGFVEEWNQLDNAAKEFARQLTGKDAATASATWKLFTSADPQAVLWLGLTTKSAVIQAKYKQFLTVWPESKQKIPYVLFQEMRITPEISGYDEMLNQLFFGIIDGKLETDEQLRAFLEPYSPPAPPPPVTVRRQRGSRKAESKSKVAAEPDFDGDPPEADDADASEEANDPAEDDEEEDEEDGEVELPPAPRKVSPVKAAPQPVIKVKAEAVAATPISTQAATVAPPAALHAVVPSKVEKVHVMAKPVKAAPASPVLAVEATHPAPPAAKKAAVPIKPHGVQAVAAKAPVKSVPVKPALAKVISAKPGNAKPAKRAPIKPAPAKAARPVKKLAKPIARPHKKVEPAKKAVVKKPSPVRKHR